VYGWLGLLDKVGAEVFSDEDECLAGILAAQVGRIYENSSLYADLRHHAAELELKVAERTHTQEALVESETRKGAILDSALDCIVTMDKDGLIREFNPAAEKVFGYRRADILGKALVELIIPPALREKHRAGLARFLATREGTILGKRIEMVGMRADGTELPIELSITHFHVRGEPMFTAIIRDITARKQAVEALRASEERTRLLLNSTAEAIYGIDLQGHCTFANPACVRLLGYAEPRQLLGKSTHALIHHTRVDGTPYPEKECRIFQAFRAGEGTHVEDEVLWRADGSSFPVEYWSYPMRHEGRIVGLVVTFLDITERRRLEDQFHQAQCRLQHVVASSPAVLYTLTGKGEDLRPTWISENVRKMLGYPVEEVFQPRWWHEHVHPEDLQQVRSEIQNELFTHGRLAHEHRFRHRDGKYRWIRSEMLLLRTAAGHPEEVVGSWSDISERKQLEDQFRQSQKMEAVGRLAGGVAHDFNNLLTVINGYGEMVMSRLPADDPARKMLQQVVTAGDRAAGLTRQLLAFSRKTIIEPKILDLKAVVTDVDKILQRVIGEDIQMTIVSDPEVGAVKADACQIGQVIMNLVVNAGDAMPKGGQLTIEVRNVVLDEIYTRDHHDTRAGRFVLLAVSDTGCGIDKPTMSRIFEPFFTTKGERGTGLGLATVHGIVKQSGGHVAVYSEVGHGTTFKVYLPQVEQDPISGKLHQRLEVLPRGSETVLFVEDEEGVRALSRHVLQDYGYAVLEARDGVEALRLAGQHQGRIDLLVTDVIMPRMGGREVAEQLAKTHPGTKVLFVSGYTDDAVVRNGILEAKMAFLHKPFSPASLVIKVRDVLDNKTEVKP